MDYVEYLKEQIKRLELIQSYQRKADNSNKEKTKDYYHEGMTLLFQQGENMENYSQILEEYKTALKVRENVIDQLYNEIKIIKKFKWRTNEEIIYYAKKNTNCYVCYVHFYGITSYSSSLSPIYKRI
jgi:methylase of polypeptide subunit release factors